MGDTGLLGVPGLLDRAAKTTESDTGDWKQAWKHQEAWGSCRGLIASRRPLCPACGLRLSLSDASIHTLCSPGLDHSGVIHCICFLSWSGWDFCSYYVEEEQELQEAKVTVAIQLLRCGPGHLQSGGLWVSGFC